MSGPSTNRDTWIDCLLAIEDAGFPPEQKIPESSLLLAFLMATKLEGDPAETRSLSELFIDQLKKGMANPQPPSTQEMIAETQTAISELSAPDTRAPASKLIPLQFALAALKTKLRKDVQNN